MFWICNVLDFLQVYFFIKIIYECVVIVVVVFSFVAAFELVLLVPRLLVAAVACEETIQNFFNYEETEENE